jgi:phenylpropionate dioxygenase-like ring-hydroxylating dioxygenase large terminal subunit
METSINGRVQAVLSRLPPLEGHEAAAPMLPRECYFDPDFFEFEKKAVFARSWVCVGRIEQIPNKGDYLTPEVASEPLIVVRDVDGALRAMSAVCQHRGQILAREPGNARRFVCPLHAWSYDLEGCLVGAPRMGNAQTLKRLRESVHLAKVGVEVWHGFIFVNLDRDAKPLAPGLAKLEPYWEGYEDSDLVGVPPVISDKPLPWNWKTQLENFTDAYHTEFVHRGTHDFAPSVMKNGGVSFTDMSADDDAIVRSVPLLSDDGGMMQDGWGPEAEFPPIATLKPEQRRRLTFALVPPSLTLVFAPNTIAFAFLAPKGPEETLAANDRVTGGGWLVPRETLEHPDFAEKAARVREGARKIWAQDVPVNINMQAGKRSAFAPSNMYGPLETTLLQFNAWLLRRYHEGAACADRRVNRDRNGTRPGGIAF